MAKKKKGCVVGESSMPDQNLNLYGKDVIKNGKVDQKVKFYVTGKISNTGREEYMDGNPLSQRIKITSIKKVMSGADLDAKVSEKVNNA